MIKERAIKFQEEKEEMEDIINRGISKFNNINDKRVEHIEESIDYLSGSDTPVVYHCGENGIGIHWFENVGRCGSTDYEKEYQLIPYAYFEEDDDECNNLNSINADIQIRKMHEEKIKRVQREKIELNSNRLEIEKDIRELSQMGTRHGIDTKEKIAEKKRELVQCKANLNRKETELTEVKREL